jgi:hypothetical protein
MIKVEEVSNWVNSKEYRCLLNCLVEKLGLQINDDAVPDILLQFDVDSLSLSRLEVTQISNIAGKTELVCNYVREKLKSLEGTEDEQEGMHPENEKSVVIEELPFYKNFLNAYLIELHFLIFHPHGLEPYLKSTRIPKAKKYAKLLSDAFSAASTDCANQ